MYIKSSSRDEHCIQTNCSPEQSSIQLRQAEDHHDNCAEAQHGCFVLGICHPDGCGGDVGIAVSDLQTTWKKGWVLRVWCRGRMGRFQLPRLGQLAITFLQADEGFDQDIEVEIKFFEYFGTFPRRSPNLLQSLFFCSFLPPCYPKEQLYVTICWNIWGIWVSPSCSKRVVVNLEEMAYSAVAHSLTAWQDFSIFQRIPVRKTRINRLYVDGLYMSIQPILWLIHVNFRMVY